MKNKSIQQFTPVYHIEFGKGSVVAVSPRGKDELVMVYFPQTRQHDWVLASKLHTNTDDHMSLEPIPQEDTDNTSDEIHEALKSLFFGVTPKE
jgi:hypothetical protein